MHFWAKCWVIGLDGWRDGYPLLIPPVMTTGANNSFVRKDRLCLHAGRGNLKFNLWNAPFSPWCYWVRTQNDFSRKNRILAACTWVSPTDSLLGWYEDIVWWSVKAYKWRTSLQLSNQRKSSLPERKMLSTTTSNKIMVSALILLPSLATASILPIKFNFGSSGNSFPSLKSVQQCEGHQDDALVGC